MHACNGTLGSCLAFDRFGGAGRISVGRAGLLSTGKKGAAAKGILLQQPP